MARFIVFDKAIDLNSVMIDMDQVYSIEPVNYVVSGDNVECVELYYGDEHTVVIGSILDLIDVLRNLQEGGIGIISDNQNFENVRTERNEFAESKQ